MDRYIETNGITLHVVEHGAGNRTLVLCPGLTANAHVFDVLVMHGLADNMRVLALDLRGRGESEKPASGYEMTDHAADVLGLLDALKLDTVVMGGHSFGGLLTYWMATHHPQRVNRCVVLDAPAEVDPGILEQIRPFLERLGKPMPSWEAYLTALKQQPYFDDWEWDPAIESYFRADVENLPDGCLRARSHPDHIQAAAEGILHVNWPGVMGQIEQPTLLVCATRPFGPPGSPPILPQDTARCVVNLLHHGHLVEIDANHLTMLFGDPANQIVRAIHTFLAR